MIERVQKLGATMGGVFSYSDLFNLMGASSELKNKRLIKRLVTEGFLFKIQRGFYTTKDPDLWVLTCRIKKNVCISMDSVLAKNGLTGTIPQSISAIYPGPRKKILNTPLGPIRFFSIKKDLIFGVNTLPQGVRAANSEKAYLDILYYYLKGARFVVDPLRDIDLWKLDRIKIGRYLKHYRNPKFRRFVKGLVDGQN